MDDDSVNNSLYAIKAVEKEEIPAEAFVEAPESFALLLLLEAAAAAGAGVAVGVVIGRSAETVGTGAVGVGSFSGPVGETKALDEENCMPPYRPPALLDIVSVVVVN